MTDCKNVIYSKRFHRMTDEEIKEMMEEAESNKLYNTSAIEGSFIDFLNKNRKIVPNENQIAKKDKFINLVMSISNDYEIDADLTEYDGYYIAHLYLENCSYSGYLKKLLSYLFFLAGDFAFYPQKDDSGVILFSYTYYTHDIYLNGRKITD